jgi:type II secretory pathway component PulF
MIYYYYLARIILEDVIKFIKQYIVIVFLFAFLIAFGIFVYTKDNSLKEELPRVNFKQELERNLTNMQSSYNFFTSHGYYTKEIIEEQETNIHIFWCSVQQIP